MREGILKPVDYKCLASGIEIEDEHSAIAGSQSSRSSVGNKAFVYMAGSPEEIARRLEQQARAQQAQQEMMQAQQRTIDELKGMVALLLVKPERKIRKQGSSSKTASSSKAETSSKGKWKEA